MKLDDLLVSQPDTGEQALEMTSGQHVDLLITEVFIEPMNGFTLRNKMENRHTGVRTIFLSGYDLSPYKEHTNGYEVIAKPASPQKLFPAVARAMAGWSAARRRRSTGCITRPGWMQRACRSPA